MSEPDYSTVNRNNAFFNSSQSYAPNTPYNNVYNQQQQQRLSNAPQQIPVQQQRSQNTPYNTLNQSAIQQSALKQSIPSIQSGPGRGITGITQQLNGLSMNNGYNNNNALYTNNYGNDNILSLGTKQSSQSSTTPLNFASVAAGLNNNINTGQELPRVFDNSEFPALSTMGQLDIDKQLQPNASQTTSVIHDDFPALSPNSQTDQMNNNSTLSSMDSELRKSNNNIASRGAVGSTNTNTQTRYNNTQSYGNNTLNNTLNSSAPTSNTSHQNFGNNNNTQSRLFGLSAPVSTQLQPNASNTVQPSNTRTNSQSSQNSQQSTKSKNNDKYSILGLLPVIRRLDPDLSMLSLGTDLQTLGLNLNSSDMLYATFGSALSDVCVRSEPDYVLPHCYYQQPPPLKTSHLTKFTLETLFYIFYNMPKDTLQLYAAKELYNRQWKYHKDIKLWFTRSNNIDTTNINNTDGFQSDYVYFDINVWQHKYWRDTAVLQDTSKFMTDQELTMTHS